METPSSQGTALVVIIQITLEALVDVIDAHKSTFEQRFASLQ